MTDEEYTRELYRLIEYHRIRYESYKKELSLTINNLTYGRKTTRRFSAKLPADKGSVKKDDEAYP
jgi:hypothetical protein